MATHLSSTAAPTLPVQAMTFKFWMMKTIPFQAMDLETSSLRCFACNFVISMQTLKWYPSHLNAVAAAAGGYDGALQQP